MNTELEGVKIKNRRRRTMKTPIQQLIEKYDRPHLEKDYEYWIDYRIDDVYEYGIEIGIQLVID